MKQMRKKNAAKIPEVPEPFWENSRWIEAHYSEFVDKYPDQWIAVANRQIIAHGRNRAMVKKMAEKKIKDRPFPLVFVECGNHVY